jgi:hypothetical protein
MKRRAGNIRWANPQSCPNSCSAESSAPLKGSEIPSKPPGNKPVPKDGFEALKGLQNVQNVICVAFGAFDRYYISWEDTNGEFHQG